MRQALWILRKDIRHLWPWVAAVWLLAAVYAVADASVPRHPVLGNIPWLGFPLGLAIVLLVVLVVQEDRLSGDRQFWVTRPYSWKSLLLAKGIFAMVFINLPIFLAQTAALAANGISPVIYFPQLLAGQVALAAVPMLLCATLAALTANLAQALLAMVACYTALPIGLILASQIVNFNNGQSMGAAAPINGAGHIALLLVLGGAAIVLQYSRRSPITARFLFVFGLVSLYFQPLVPWRTAFAIAAWGSRPVDAAAVRLAPDLSRKTMAYGAFDRDTNWIFIPIQVTAIPEGMEVFSERVKLTVETADGEQWSSGWSGASQVCDKPLATDPAQRLLPGAGGPYTLRAGVKGSIYARFSTVPVHLHAAVAFTMLGPAHVRRIDPALPPSIFPDGSSCSFSKSPTLVTVFCFTPVSAPGFRLATIQPLASGDPRYASSVQGMQIGSENTNLFSVWQSLSGGIALPTERFVATFETRQAVAHFERELDMPGIRLADFGMRSQR